MIKSGLGSGLRFGFGLQLLQIIAEHFQRGTIPEDRRIQLFLPKSSHRRAHVISRGEEIEAFVHIKGYGPGRPAGAEIELFFQLFGSVVIAQVDEADASRAPDDVELQ